MNEPAYLDFAATAALRPEEVVEAVADFLRGVGATPGRAAHVRAVEAGRLLLRCRRALAALLNLPGDPGRVVFQPSATHALNTALFGFLRPGDRVVRTAYDHNAVRRPLAVLARERGVVVDVLSGRADGGVDLAEAERLLQGGSRPARLLVLPHVSNVLGSTLPVRELADRARAAGARVLVDAAQSVGHLPVDAEALRADLLAFSGHKGLLGPQGTGVLWIREGVEVAPLVHGGTGAGSDSDAMPAALPDRLEAGTQNAPGIAGLLAGVEWVQRRGVHELHAREAALKADLLRRLAEVPEVQVVSPAAPDGTGIVTLVHRRMDPARLALRLEREHGVLVRAGLHCAPGAHRVLGTERTGAVRLSVGWATTESDVERAASALTTISAESDA